MICDKCVKKSVCKIYDGANIQGCIEFARPIDVVLQDIRQNIEEKFSDCDICEWVENYDYEETDISEYRSIGSVNEILNIKDEVIKKYGNA